MPIENGMVHQRQIFRFLWLTRANFYQKRPEQVLK